MSKVLKLTTGAETVSSDCWQLIFNHLNNDELKAISSVCKDFLAISNLVKKTLKVLHPNVHVLTKHLNRFTELNKIDLSKFHGDLDKAIRAIARSELSLEAIDFCPEATFEAESLRELGSNPKMRNLKGLNCFLTKRLHDEDLAVIANSFPNLEELNVCRYDYDEKKNPSDYGVKILASKLRVLKKILISVKRNKLTDESIVALSLNCTFLKDVTIISNGDAKVTEHGIGLLLRNRPNLESLCIGKIEKDSTASSTITIENSISHAKSLTFLTCHVMDISDELLMEIGKAKLPLKNVELLDCRNFTVSGLRMVVSKHLNKLSIKGSDCEADYGDIKLLLQRDVANLTHIEISHSLVTSLNLYLLSTKFPSLEKLKISNVILDDEASSPPSRKSLFPKGLILLKNKGTNS
ncbi:EIN3-binding F-box protein 1-like protein [Corchorus olitorius]|uniref:EIN3-binding F-box protein 1-like protein n=1 Tax=Corchorus olitorius TaxID=93759 RepID=A0A1R3IMN6_9ROSI|nr:EIN3-binding F-box protein 1-like protein [Corchorus olitorius]